MANALAPAILALAPTEGISASRYPGIRFYRLTSPEPPTPTVHAASITLVGAGEKRGTLGGHTYVYDERHYIVVASPLPMVCQTLASRAKPAIAVSIDVDLELLREVVDADVDAAPSAEPARPIVVRAPLRPVVEATGLRLLGQLGSERETRVLARQTVRELLFHVLTGPRGNDFRALTRGPVSQLSRVLSLIGERFAEPLPIAELARLAHMSVPTFHHHFRRITSTTPLQYIKAIRLTRARQLLVGGAAAKEAAHQVGYESESQFSREFSRYFGAPPSRLAELSRTGVAPRRTGRRRTSG